MVEAQSTPEINYRFATLGGCAWTPKPDAFNAEIRADIKTKPVLLKAAGLEVQK